MEAGESLDILYLKEEEETGRTCVIWQEERLQDLGDGSVGIVFAA